MMQRSYVMKDNGDQQALIVFYDAQRKGAVLGWVTHTRMLGENGGTRYVRQLAV